MAKSAKNKADGADEFEASGPVTPTPVEVPEESDEQPTAKTAKTAKPKVPQDVPSISPTAAELQPVFAAQDRAIRERQLEEVAKKFPAIAELIAERDALRARVAELEAK